MDAAWTIDELGSAAAAVLSALPQENGQIREIPDRRTIRYYTTLGLLDRPTAMRGRTALYGKRHLDQLVAIKRLQAEGRSLQDIQASLSGITPKELKKLADLPYATAEAPAPMARDPMFWKAEPGGTASVVRDAVSKLAALRIDEATILFDSTRALTDDDARALRSAAQPLLDALRARGLTER